MIDDQFYLFEAEGQVWCDAWISGKEAIIPTLYLTVDEGLRDMRATRPDVIIEEPDEIDTAKLRHQLGVAS